jgi:uncharacterized protein
MLRNSLALFIIILWSSYAYADLESAMVAYEAGDYETAVKELLSLAEAGEAKAQYGLGLTYRNGTGVKQDDAEALKWYKKAAEQGYAPAQMGIGVIYFQGKGVETDDSEAFRWFRKAAKQGDAGAQNKIGEMYMHGVGVKQNHDHAMVWFHKAAEQGHVIAERNIAVLEPFVSPETTEVDIPIFKNLGGNLEKGEAALLLPYFERNRYFDGGREIIRQLIIDEFRRYGIRVTEIGQSEYSDEWSDVISEYGSIFAYGKPGLDEAKASRVLGKFIQMIGIEHNYDGFIIPSLVTRPTNLVRVYAKWDGVQRRLIIKRKGGGSISSKGSGTGVSLHLRVFDRSLRISLGESYGGLVIPYYMDWIAEKSYPRDNMFENNKHLREGVEIAVDTFQKNQVRAGSQD